MTSQSKLHFGRETKSAPEVGWKSINPKYQLTGTSQKHVTVNQSYLATQQLKCTTGHKKKKKTAKQSYRWIRKHIYSRPHCPRMLLHFYKNTMKWNKGEKHKGFHSPLYSLKVVGALNKILSFQSNNLDCL